jgi:hypothetical protein
MSSLTQGLPKALKTLQVRALFVMRLEAASAITLI